MDENRRPTEVPAMFLLATGALGVLLQVWGLVDFLSGPSEVPGWLIELLPQDLNGEIEEAMSGASAWGWVDPVFKGIGSAFVVFGALKMRETQAYGIAIAASILAMIPCSGACCLGLPVGIWCLVILLNDDVKKAFS